MNDIKAQERQNKKELRLFKKYKKAKALKQCVMEYFQYGFDPGFDCGCKDCESYSNALDIVEDKNINISAMDALLNNGFTKDEAQKQIDIFNNLGIFTDLEIHGANKRS